MAIRFIVLICDALFVLVDMLFVLLTAAIRSAPCAVPQSAPDPHLNATDWRTRVSRTVHPAVVGCDMVLHQAFRA